MTVTLKSNNARLKWREILNAARAGEDTIIKHYDTPIAVVVPYADFLALQDELDDLRAARRAQAAYDAWKENPNLGRPWEEIKAEWVQDGLLDA